MYIRQIIDVRCYTEIQNCSSANYNVMLNICVTSVISGFKVYVHTPLDNGKVNSQLKLSTLMWFVFQIVQQKSHLRP